MYISLMRISIKVQQKFFFKISGKYSKKCSGVAPFLCGSGTGSLIAGENVRK
jgi:hypothetical protein